MGRSVLVLTARMARDVLKEIPLKVVGQRPRAEYAASIYKTKRCPLLATSALGTCCLLGDHAGNRLVSSWGSWICMRGCLQMTVLLSVSQTSCTVLTLEAYCYTSTAKTSSPYTCTSLWHCECELEADRQSKENVVCTATSVKCSRN